MAGLEPATTKKVLDGMGKKLKTKIPYIANRANYHAKSSIFKFPKFVLDTGNLRDKTRGEAKQVSKYGVNVTFGTYNVPYLSYPFYGLGTSKNYGTRKWLEVARSDFMKEFGMKK